MPIALARRARLALFDLDPGAAQLDVRGFAATTPAKRERLEQSGGAFIDGYRAGIRTGDPGWTAEACESAPAPLRGFAYEGGAMALSMLDLFTSGVPRRLRRFADEHAGLHLYMVHVGAGWAIARCPWGAVTFLPKLDPVLRWLTVDGMGFHAAFFNPAAMFEQRRTPRLRRCEPDAFDAGLGRALWFVAGAQPALVSRRVASFDQGRRPALWSGVGLAAAYAGGASDADLHDLVTLAGEWRAHLALGAAFAAKARERAGNPAEHTDRACRVACRLSAAEAAAWTDRCLEEGAEGTDGTIRQGRQLLVRVFSSAAPGPVQPGGARASEWTRGA